MEKRAKLQKLAKILEFEREFQSNPPLATLSKIEESIKPVSESVIETQDAVIKVSESVNELAQTIETKIERKVAEIPRIIGPRGFKGDVGERGEKGERGERGETVVIEKVIEKTEVIKEQPIIKTEVREVENKATPKEIKDKLESLKGEDRLSAKAIKDLPSTVDTLTRGIWQGVSEVRVKELIKETPSTSGASAFTDLTDTPSSYIGQGGKAVYVNPGETGLQFQVAVSSDEKVKYDASDPTAGYVADKFVAGTGITLSEGTGADENKLKITNTLDLSGYLKLDQTTPQTTTGTFTFPSVVATNNLSVGSTSTEFRLTLDKGAVSPDGGILSIGDYGSGNTLSHSGSGTRLLWYPRKAAFRAGYIGGAEWDESNIGSYSVAFGQGNKASGTASSAIGAFNTASGNYSFVSGVLSSATNHASTAIGDNSSATGMYSLALGQYLTASTNNAIAIGKGVDNSHRLVNNTANSLMVGFGSTVPTLFVSTNVGVGTTTANQKLSVAGTLGIIETGDSPQYYTIFQGGDQSADITYTLPTSSTTGLLKNTSGVLSWDTNTYLTSVTPHNLLSTTHGDTTAGSVARGDLITGQGASPTWTRLAIGSNGKVLTSNGTDISWETPSAGFTNPMTTLGDIIFENATPTADRLAGNTTTTKKYLRSLGSGGLATAPSWEQIAYADISGTPSLTGYALLDGSNTPFTGDIGITKSSAKLTLTNSGGNAKTIALLADNSTDASYLKATTGVLGSTPYSSQTSGSNYWAKTIATMVSEDVTISLWVKPTSNVGVLASWGYNYTGNEAGFILSLGDAGGGNAGGVYWSSGNNSGNDNANAIVGGSAGSITTGSWQHIMIVKSGTSVTIYKNNSQIVTGTVARSGITSASNSFRLGASSGEATYWTTKYNGLMDEVIVWNRALTSDERTTVYNSGSGNYAVTTNSPYNSGLVEGWHADEGSGNSLAGISSTHTLTGVSTPTFSSDYKVATPSSDSEVAVITVTDGVTAGANGTIKFGNTTADTILDGNNLALQLGGVTKGALTSTGMEWSLPNTITGVSDAIQLKVVSNATQTTNPFAMYQSDGTTVVHEIDNNGNVGLKGASTLYPKANSTAALKVGQADKTVFVSFDSTNKRIRIGDATVPTATLDVLGKLTFDSTNGYLTVTNISTPIQSTISSGLAVNTGLVSGANGVFVAKGSIDQSLIITDTANDRVGIGVASPTVKLDVAGSQKFGTASTDVCTHTGRMVVRTLSADPTSSATAGTLGEIAFYNNKWYGKTTASGTDTNWSALN